MKTLRIESLEQGLRRKLRKAKEEPLLLTEQGTPVLVVRDLLDDDVADELIAASPEFRKTIDLARKQKALGRVKTFAAIRRKYKC